MKCSSLVKKSSSNLCTITIRIIEVPVGRLLAKNNKIIQKAAIFE